MSDLTVKLRYKGDRSGKTKILSYDYKDVLEGEGVFLPSNKPLTKVYTFTFLKQKLVLNIGENDLAANQKLITFIVNTLRKVKLEKI
jgi:hypothetical protein